MSDAIVPGKVSHGSAGARENFSAQEALLEALRVMPALRVIDIESWGDFPLTVPTGLASIVGALAIGVFEYGFEGQTIVDYGSIAWAHGDEPGDLKILGIQNLVFETHYTIRLLVIGKAG